MDGEIYLWRDRNDPETILLGTGRDGCDDRNPDVTTHAALKADAITEIFGSAGYELLDRLNEAGRPLCFTIEFPEL